jgi:hypothetical protein
MIAVVGDMMLVAAAVVVSVSIGNVYGRNRAWIYMNVMGVGSSMRDIVGLIFTCSLFIFRL